jgi:hypothetical protein
MIPRKLFRVSARSKGCKSGLSKCAKSSEMIRSVVNQQHEKIAEMCVS